MLEHCRFCLSISTVVLALSLTPGVAAAQESFGNNRTPISVPGGGTNGPAAPFPSEIEISGASGELAGIEVQLHGLTHSAVEDLAISLVGPDKTQALLMFYAGSGAVSDVGLIFMEDGSPVPEFGAIGNAEYRPTSYATAPDAPTSHCFPTKTSLNRMPVDLSVFRGSDMNGTWRLYVCDMMEVDSGSFAEGWTLTVWPHNQ